MTWICQNPLNFITKKIKIRDYLRHNWVATEFNFRITALPSSKHTVPSRCFLVAQTPPTHHLIQSSVIKANISTYLPMHQNFVSVPFLQNSISMMARNSYLTINLFVIIINWDAETRGLLNTKLWPKVVIP